MAKGHRSQIKKERNIATQEKRPHATAKYVGIPAPKAKIVLDQIKGKDVATAAAMLSYSPRLAAEIIGKVLKSAVANAENNLGFAVYTLIFTLPAVLSIVILEMPASYSLFLMNFLILTSSTRLSAKSFSAYHFASQSLMIPTLKP